MGRLPPYKQKGEIGDRDAYSVRRRTISRNASQGGRDAYTSGVGRISARRKSVKAWRRNWGERFQILRQLPHRFAPLPARLRGGTLVGVVGVAGEMVPEGHLVVETARKGRDQPGELLEPGDAVLAAAADSHCSVIRGDRARVPKVEGATVVPCVALAPD